MNQRATFHPVHACVPHSSGTPEGWGTDFVSRGSVSVTVIARTILPPPFVCDEEWGTRASSVCVVVVTIRFRSFEDQRRR